MDIIDIVNNHVDKHFYVFTATLMCERINNSID